MIVCRRLLYSLFAVVLLLGLSSCSMSYYMNKANKKYDAGEYDAASDALRRVVRRIPNKKRVLKGEVNYKIGECYSHINLPDRASRAYKSSIRFRYEGDNVHLKMAKMLHAGGKYKEARASYEKHMEIDPTSFEAEKGLVAMDSILLWNKYKTRHKIGLAKEFNYRRTSNFSPMFMGEDSESIVISSNRVKGKKRVMSAITGVPNNDLYITRKNRAGKWEDLEAIEGSVNTEHDEGAVSFSPDGKTMYYTLCANDNETARIFKTQRTGGEWGEPAMVQLFADSSLSAGHPAISPEGDVMYIVSDADGGFGGNDIWYSLFLEGKWGEPINAGPSINTPGDEMFPYMDKRGNLYFSSNGHAGYGGLDLFKAKNDSLDVWTVHNMKAPFNSRWDDFGIVFEGVSNNGYFSSNRNQSRYIDLIYRFDLPDMYFRIRGKVESDSGDELSEGVIRLVGDNGDIVKLKTKKDGSYNITLYRGVNYVMMASHRGYLNASYVLNTKGLEDSKVFDNDFQLSSLTKSVKMNNIFFEFGKWTLTDNSEAGLQSLVKMLNDNPNIVMEISAHTDMVGDEAANENLSQKRAQSVVDYLVNAGIAKDRVVAKGYGESKPAVVDKRMSKRFRFMKEGDVLTPEYIDRLNEKQQEVCNGMNRRTEFKVIKTTYNLY